MPVQFMSTVWPPLYPALIAAVLRETDRTTLKAVVHCQGSTSFALALAAGLLPEVTTIVSNADAHA
jgi:hypothetical protein